MKLKLSDVFSTLLSADEEAVNSINAARSEADRMRKTLHDEFEAKRSESIEAAHKEARGITDSARQKAEAEALQITNAGISARKKIKELFDQHSEQIIARLADEVAESCAARGKSV